MGHGHPTASSVSSVPKTFIREIEGVVGSWHLDEGAGTIAHDTSGNANHGSLGAGVAGERPKWITGRVGGALQFDGVNDFVSVPHSESLNITGDITIGLWVNPGPTQVSHADIISKHGPGYFLEQAGDMTNRFYLAWHYTPALLTGYHITTKLTANVGQHFVVVKSGATITHFVNGSQTATGVGASPTITPNTLPLMIGRWSSGGGRHFHGLIDEVRIYNRALSAEEISSIFHHRGHTTIHYPGRALVHKYSHPEPIISIS